MTLAILSFQKATGQLFAQAMNYMNENEEAKRPKLEEAQPSEESGTSGLAKSVQSSSALPPFNPAAKVPAEIYNLADIVQEDLMDILIPEAERFLLLAPKEAKDEGKLDFFGRLNWSSIFFIFRSSDARHGSYSNDVINEKCGRTDEESGLLPIFELFDSNEQSDRWYHSFRQSIRLGRQIFNAASNPQRFDNEIHIGRRRRRRRK